MMYFTITSQFNDPDPITIDETELIKAITGQLTGNPVVFKRASVSGSMIKNSKIVPNLSKAEKVYNPSGEDYIPPKIREAHHLAIENAGEMVKAQMEHRSPQLKAPSNPSVRLFTKEPTAIGEYLDRRGSDEY